jgi:hypothetical protein
MNYSSLEEAYGTPFGQRVPITHERKDAKEAPVAKPEFSSLSNKSDESVKKHKALVESMTNSLPLDQSPTTENFYVETPAPVVARQQVRERFTDPAPAAPSEDKLSRILRLIEQNKTGYERAATQDMALYVFTGVFLLFTLDTFVMLGKSMRGRPT